MGNNFVIKVISALLGLAVAVSSAVLDEPLEDFDYAKELKEEIEAGHSDIGSSDDFSGIFDEYAMQGNRHGIVYGWGVPILRISIRQLDKSIDIRRFNKFLTDKIMSVHNRFEAQYSPLLRSLSGDKISKGADSAGDINSAFFRWQTLGGWDHYFGGEKEFKTFKRLSEQVHDVMARECKQKNFKDIVSDYLEGRSGENGEESVHVSEEELKERSPEDDAVSFHPWAAVNKYEMNHEEHDHEDARFSGVYYVKVPENAGSLTFSDPRSNFHSDMEIHPQPGEFVMFPSWLRHRVSTTFNQTHERIAIAFNTPGKWSDTDETNHYPMHNFNEIEIKQTPDGQMKIIATGK